MRGPETEKNHSTRLQNGFYEKFCKGQGLDIGFRGEIKDAEPVLETAIGIDKDYPGYNGLILPFDSESKDYVFTSHVLEHIPSHLLQKTLSEWMRVLKVGGHLVLIVPHQWLYEKKSFLPSQWNGDHKRFYTPSSLFYEIERILPLNTYRVVWMRDNDDGFDYGVDPQHHSQGCYEIECVLKKINSPKWGLL